MEADIKFDHPLFEYCKYSAGRVIAVFKFQEYVQPPQEAMDQYEALRAAMVVIDQRAFHEWGGRVRIEAPRSKQVYREGVPDELAFGTELGAELRQVVRDAGFKVIDSWDNDSNSGHGFSVAFKHET